MFKKTRNQLTISYVTVIAFILAIFTVAVRLTFVRSLDQQLNLRLENLSKAAAFNIDIEEGKLDIDEEEVIVGQNQAIEWFDGQKQLVAKQGRYSLNVPLNTRSSNRIQTHLNFNSLTIAVKDAEAETLIGYVRVSESLGELQTIVRRLDYGLGIGITLALALSGVGGIWLTRQAMQPIESSFQRLQQFTADASHELRSPLMAVKTNADVALKYPEGIRSGDVEKFRAIASAADQMTRLTQSLLFLARADKLDRIEPINLSSILSELIQQYQVQARTKNQILQANILEGLHISGDKILIKQMFDNLLQNALFYTGVGGSIIVETKLTKVWVIVTIEDTGIGIATEHLPHIFERFWRVDQSRSYRDSKSGLGLAIVQEIIQLHQGKITVESQWGIGSCFTVYFPVEHLFFRNK